MDRNAGEWVQPGERVFRIVDASRVRAEGFLEASHATPDLANAVARIYVANANGREETLEGRVVFIDPELNSVNGQFRIWAEFENRASLLQAGEQVIMSIFPGTGQNVESVEPPVSDESERQP